MSLPLNQVVNLSLEHASQGATKRDLSVIAIFTDEMCDEFYDHNTRYIVVASADEVANQFGTTSRAYSAAKALFSARPKLKSALIAKHIASPLQLPEKPAKLAGSALSTGYTAFKAINDGYLSFTLNGRIVTLSNLSFKGASSLENVALIIGQALAEATNDAATINFDSVGQRFILQTSADAADIGYAYDAQLDGTYIGAMLNLIDGRATRYPYTAAAAHQVESVSEALTALENSYQNWYGAYFANVISDDQLLEAHDWVASANLKVLGYTETRSANLEWSDTNILKRLAKKSSGRLMVQYNNTGDEFAGLEMMAIALSTNWIGSNTAKTVKFKQQSSVTSDDRITLNEANKCRRLGINYYTDYAGVNMLAEGTMLGGQFIDVTTGLDAFTDALQTQLFNKLQGASAKIPQTDRGQEILIASAKVIGEQFKQNGFLAAGVWTGDEIGELSYGDTIGGYHFYSASFATQDTSDRNSRKMMPIMTALKLAGAGHSIDVVVKYNV